MRFDGNRIHSTGHFQRGQNLANIILRRAVPADTSVLRNLLELYQHDLSEYWPCELNEHGLYGYPTLDYYLREPAYAAYLLTVEGKLAGFALVNNDVCLPENEYWMAQFFVLRRYRRTGVATNAAKQLFDLMPGKWEIGQIPLNRGAQLFWRKTIDEYTNGNFSEATMDSDIWRGELQWFDNRSSQP
jgi:predicted acetyltransferase